jgi:hypothetical protein
MDRTAGELQQERGVGKGRGNMFAFFHAARHADKG